MLAGPHGMNWASFLSLILCKLLWTWVGSTSPYITNQGKGKKQKRKWGWGRKTHTKVVFDTFQRTSTVHIDYIKEELNALYWWQPCSQCTILYNSLTRCTCVYNYLYNIENGDVAVIVVSVAWGGHHDILRLQQSPHHIKYCCLTNTGSLHT